MNSSRRTSSTILHELGRDRHGIVTRERLLTAGVPSSTVQGWVRRGRLQVVIDGIYLVEGASLSWQALAIAHCAYVDMQARRICRVHRVPHVAGVSGLAAAHLLDFPWVTRPRRPYILANRPSRVHRSRVLHGFQPQLRREDLHLVHGVPVTGTGITLIEAAALLPDRRIEDLLVELPRRGALTGPGLVADLQRFPGEGSGTVIRLLHALDRDLFATRSGTERDVLRALRHRGIHDVHPNVRIDFPSASIEFDLLRGDVAEEIDGPHHLLPSQHEWDEWRDRIAAQHGITVTRTTTAALRVDFEAEVDAMAARLLGTSTALNDVM